MAFFFFPNDVGPLSLRMGIDNIFKVPHSKMRNTIDACEYVHIMHIYTCICSTTY